MRASPYRLVLGADWAALSPAVRRMHLGGVLEAEGQAVVIRGRGWLARAAAAVFGFPPGGEHTLRVRFEPDALGETWTRRFGPAVLRSRQRAAAGLLWETIGLCSFGSALRIEGGALRLELRRWCVLGLPLPLALGPRVAAREADVEGCYAFDIAIAHPLTGPIVRYCGWLVPA